MTFLCDLHLHSRFSRATSHDLTVGNLDMWARIKGVDVLGTADFTHPGWREELHKSLIRDDTTGLYKYKGTPQYVPFIPLNAACYNRQPLFLVQTEISSIYKKNGKVRKVHNLIFVPSLEDADRFSARLEKIGNLNADGRPILGLDSHDLLEILLDTVPN
ncbi:MAG: DNA helicase, partial [Desulfovibrio sp.]|nr:DNA helicase [Desulfovibrio sp.]